MPSQSVAYSMGACLASMHQITIALRVKTLIFKSDAFLNAEQKALNIYQNPLDSCILACLLEKSKEHSWS